MENKIKDTDNFKFFFGQENTPFTIKASVVKSAILSARDDIRPIKYKKPILNQFNCFSRDIERNIFEGYLGHSKAMVKMIFQKMERFSSKNQFRIRLPESIIDHIWEFVRMPLKLCKDCKDMYTSNNQLLCNQCIYHGAICPNCQIPFSVSALTEWIPIDRDNMDTFFQLPGPMSPNFQPQYPRALQRWSILLSCKNEKDSCYYEGIYSYEEPLPVQYNNNPRITQIYN